MPKRKISFNYLFLKVGDLEQPIEGVLNKVLNYIISKDKVNRKQDVNNDKFVFSAISTVKRILVCGVSFYTLY